MKNFNIVYSTDRNYLKILSVSIASLLRSNCNYHLIIHIFYFNMNINDFKLINDFTNNYNCEIKWYNVEDCITEVLKNGGSSYRGYATYARIFLDRFIDPGIDKILYIDGDTIIVDSLENLFNIELNEYVAAAVLDKQPKKYKNALGFDGTDNYYNAGVLFISMKNWRKYDIGKKLKDNIDSICSNSNMPDQDLINIILRNDILQLPLQYNLYDIVYAFNLKNFCLLYKNSKYYSTKEIQTAIENPSIIHFTDGFVGRPWLIGCTHPKKELWINLYKSLYGEKLNLKEKKLSTKELIKKKLYSINNGRIFVLVYSLLRYNGDLKTYKKYKNIRNVTHNIKRLEK